MKNKQTILAVILTVCSVLVLNNRAFAQERSGVDVFAGYANIQAEGLPDRNSSAAFFDGDFFQRRTTFHGFNASVTGFPTNIFGITGEFSFSRKGNRESVSGGEDSLHTDIYYFLAGPAWSFRNSSRVEPFVRLMGGGAHTRFEAESSRPTGSGGTSTSSFDVKSTDWAAGAGAGLDLRASEHFKIRLLQVDWLPVFLRDHSINVLGANGVIQPQTLEGKRQDNFRFSTGIVF
jgi:opacity protein-like surface antigen